ncbi:Beta-galactosidase 6 [Phytophthora pseudosyringae]|uniref:beta-galactosidase n=1 Tax=Phytophthora pseudosyringae TaxID=221518 RepID=A0A8T1W3P2_9STRA|nr:Beta-galactosidase 6 [Phytophthora pseudosyringae]
MFSPEADSEALLPVDAPRASPARRCRLQRMDVALLAVLLLVAGFVGVRPPALRASNPLLLSRPDKSYQYLTYDDIDAAKRQSGYSVAYSPRGFEIDGRQTLLLGGSIHYPRSSPGQWAQLLREAKRDGLNHVEMYVFWNLHEQERGVLNFAGNANITRFYELAAEMGLFLHVRFGPYVCAEWNNGGLPVWLNWIPDMKVRASNGPWQREMERFIRYMVELSRPYLAKNGGPIVMAQIENEFAWHDPEYIEWCGNLVKQLDTSIPWVMCYANAAENTILSCNGNDCVDFAVKNVKERPSDPLVWTEDEGWFQTWQKDKKNPLPNDQRTPEDMAYAIARWFAVGGAAHNYYMYHGGNNYGRAASAGVTTMYADGVNLHFDGLSNEPKRSHLRKLHEALIECNDVLLRNDRQVLNPHDLPLEDNGQTIKASSLQRAFVYGPEDGPNQVVFLENMAKQSVAVKFAGKKFDLGPSSMLIVKDGVLLFDTADVQKSFPGHQHRSYTPLVKAASLEWKTWSELNVSSMTPRKRVVADRAVEQLRLTADRSDYLTYETTFTLKQPSGIDGDASTVKVTSCEASSIVAFVDGNLIGERNLAYPGGNCSKEFRFHLPTNIDVDRQHDLKLASVSLGVYSLGSNHSKGVTGSVRIGHKDLTHGQQWEMYPGLVGEQLEIYRSQWLDSVPWTLVPRAASGVDVASGRQLMSWYATSFQYPSQQVMMASEQQSSVLLDFIGLTRGRAYINGHDLGRYWLNNDEGHFVQRYYHVPRDWLTEGRENLLVVFDELGGLVADVRLVSSTMVPDAAAIEADESPAVSGLAPANESSAVAVSRA